MSHLYARLAGDPAFLAGHVGLDDLAEAVGVDGETAARIGLYRVPLPGRIDPWLDRVCQHFGIDRARLATLLARIGVR